MGKMSKINNKKVVNFFFNNSNAYFRYLFSIFYVTCQYSVNFQK